MQFVGIGAELLLETFANLRFVHTRFLGGQIGPLEQQAVDLPGQVVVEKAFHPVTADVSAVEDSPAFGFD